jgi:hypothetical protein
MISIVIKKAEVQNLAALLENNAKKLKKELATAVNATAKFTQSQMAKAIALELNVSQKDIKQGIIGKRATKDVPETTVILKKGFRYKLKRFKPVQNKAGVRVKISRRRGSIVVPHAFMGPKPGQTAPKLNGHVFKREGKARKPIHILKGASPWGAFTKNNHLLPTVKQTEERLTYEINRRIRFLELKAAGKI